MAVLRIEAQRLGSVRELLAFLGHLNSAYEHLCAFDLVVMDAKERYEDVGPSIRPPRRGSSKRLRVIKKPAEIVLPSEELRLGRISISSPGFWEALGSLSPLESIRKYLADRHERKKDEQFRNSAEAERLYLENEEKRLQIVKEKIEILKRLEVPEDRIRAAITTHVSEPLRLLDRYQDSGLIEGATIRKGGEDKGDA